MGVLYCDSAGWPLIVPVVYGTAQVNALDMLKTMPASILTRLRSSPPLLTDLAVLFHDCVDYAVQLPDGAARPALSAFSWHLLGASDRKPRSSVELLLSRRLSADVSEAAAFAVELSLKGLLSIVDDVSLLPTTSGTPTPRQESLSSGRRCHRCSRLGSAASRPAQHHRILGRSTGSTAHRCRRLPCGDVLSIGTVINFQ